MKDKKIRKLYKGYIDRTSPDTEAIWSKIEAELDKEPAEAPISSPPKRSRIVRFSKAFALTAACIAVVFLTKNILFENGFSFTKSENYSYSQAPDSEKANSPEYGKNETAGLAPQAPHNDNDMPSDNAEGLVSEDYFNSPKESYDGLKLADSPKPDYELATESQPQGTFFEDAILKDTDLFIDAIVTDVSFSDDKSTVTYSLEAVKVYSNEKLEITKPIIVSEKTAFPLKLNREYLLPLKKTDDGFTLIPEYAPRIEITLDKRLVFHGGWESLVVNSSPLVYPKTNNSDLFFDKMRISDGFDISKLLEKWKTFQEEIT